MNYKENKMNILNENPIVKYRVEVDGNVLNESLNKALAEQFVSTLLPEQRNRAIIVPITETGAQVLFG